MNINFRLETFIVPGVCSAIRTKKLPISYKTSLYINISLSKYKKLISRAKLQFLNSFCVNSMESLIDFA